MKRSRYFVPTIDGQYPQDILYWKANGLFCKTRLKSGEWGEKHFYNDLSWQRDLILGRIRKVSLKELALMI